MASRSLKATRAVAPEAMPSSAAAGPPAQGGRERTEALRGDAGGRGGDRQPRPPLLLAPRVTRPGQVGDAPVAQPGQVLDDLPGAVGEVGDHARQPRHLAVVQHHGQALREVDELGVRQPARGQHDPVDDRAQPVEVLGLQRDLTAGVPEHESAPGDARLGLRAADQSEVVGVRDVGDEQAEHQRAARGQRASDAVGPVAQPPRHLLHARAGHGVDPVGSGERARHGGHRDPGLARHVVQRDGAATGSAWDESRHRL